MGRQLAVLIPSRGRPQRVAETVAAYAKTCLGDYQICWAFDDDDPELEANKAAAGTGPWGGKSYIWTGPRNTLAGWTNVMWRELEGEFGYFGSFGDDHLPVTHGWDTRLTAVLEAKGGGFAYCDNGQPAVNYPEMCVISAPVCSALGYVAEPSMRHYCIDVVWMELGEAAGCLYYLPDVIVRHRHWAFGLGPRDDTYWEAAERGREDVLAHEKWKAERMDADVARVLSAVVQP